MGPLDRAFHEPHASQGLDAPRSQESSEEALPFGADLLRVKLCGNENGLVRNLPGFVKGRHKEPNEINGYHGRWIKEIAKDLLRQELDAVASRLKKLLKFKRTDIVHASLEGGSGELATRYFDYIIELDQDSRDPREYVVQRRLENFSGCPEVLSRPDFDACFVNAFHSVVLPLSGNLRVEDVIDRIEAIDDPSLIEVEYDSSDLSRCVVKLPEFQGDIVVTSKELQIRSLSASSPSVLFSLLRNCYAKIAGNAGASLGGP